MNVICSDMEGVFTPEIWIKVAEKTGIDELRITTRDEPDYDKLMRYRIDILDKKGLKLKDIQDVISEMEPLQGAKEFLDWMRRKAPVIIVSDTFEQFAAPLMEKLGLPTLFCNTLEVEDGKIVGYKLRQPDQKRHVVEALQQLHYGVIAMGDSYNDVSMIKKAENGAFFKPPERVIEEFPEFPVAQDYEKMKDIVRYFLGSGYHL